MEAWLPRLSLALLPLELLLLQLVLAGGNPGPAPRLEMVLLWALAVLLPQLRPPWVLPLALLRPVLAVLQLPLLLWLDQRAGLATTVSPWADQSRVACLLWALLLLLAIQWQLRSALGTVSIAIPPEQSATNQQSEPLNSEVGEGDNTTTGGAQSHGGGTDSGGSEEGQPEGPA
jgi:hypothetical protein|tara:strand:- start:2203 stop:2724 length:522 start_codon:yes stop_codon:yes gene_type:complete